MIKVYIDGCTTCGINAVYLRKVRKYANRNNIEFELHNSKYDLLDRVEHTEYLKKMGLRLDRYAPIVVYDGEPIRLQAWTL